MVLSFLAGVGAGVWLTVKVMNRRRWPKHFTRHDQTIKLAINTDDKKQGWFIKLPEHQLVKLRILAAGVINGKNLSGAVWSGHGKLFSRADYEVITDLCLSRGWAAWNNPEAHNQGMTPTVAGMAAFRQLAGMRSPRPGVKEYSEAKRMHVDYAHTETNK